MSITVHNHVLIWSNDYNKPELKEVSFNKASTFTWEHVILGKDVTARTFLRIIETDVEFWTKALGEPYLPDLIKHYQDNCKDKKFETDFCRTSIGWRCMIDKHKVGHLPDVFQIGDQVIQRDEPYTKEDDDFEFNVDFSAIKIADNDDDDHFAKKGEEIYYACDMQPIENLLDCPIVVNEKVELFINYFGWRRKVPKKYEVGKKGFTLLEALKAFVYEVTFLGSEEDKSEKLESLQERIEEAKESLDKGDDSNFHEFKRIPRQEKKEEDEETRDK